MFAIDSTMFEHGLSGKLQLQVWLEQLDRILKPGALIFGYDAKPIEDLLTAKPRQYKLLNAMPDDTNHTDNMDTFYYRAHSIAPIFLEKK
jgi:hypothetical protein